MNGLASRATDRLGSRPDVRLGIALTIACALHATAILGIDLPARDSSFIAPPLEISLVRESAPASFAGTSPQSQTSSSSMRGEPASALADTRSPAVPVTGLDSVAPVSSASLSGGHARPPDNTMPQPEMAPTSSPATDRPTEGQVPSSDSGFDSPPRNSGLSYPELAKKIADAHSLREQADAIRPGGPRTKRLTSTSAKSAVEAAYLEMWRQKTERIGRANYPPGGLSGELLLLAVIHRDGNLEEVRVLESSGYAALDEAALRTVRLAAPYTHFPAEMRESYDRLEIVRRWRFEREGAVLQ